MSSMPKLTHDIAELRRMLAARRSVGERVVLVPTMGYLHFGHISLMKQAREHGQCVAASVFVNPSQFNDPKDLEAYPRDLNRDMQLMAEAGVDLVFAPAPGSMYGPHFQSWVNLEKLPAEHDGASRPGHFRGVATVVSMLFNLFQPDAAVFGEKDFQQLRIIEQLVEDLKFPVKIVRGKLVRESDGLAMSSRNVRLSPAGRAVAPQIFASLQAGVEEYQSGERRADRIREAVVQHLARTPELRLDYCHVVDEQELKEVTQLSGPARILIACFLEGVRLIDNVGVR